MYLLKRVSDLKIGTIYSPRPVGPFNIAAAESNFIYIIIIIIIMAGTKV